MVNTAETDIVSPSVTAEYPLGLLSEEVFVLHDSPCSSGSRCRPEPATSLSVAVPFDRTDIRKVSKPLFASSLITSSVALVLPPSQLSTLPFKLVTDCVLSQKHTITELCVVLEQGVVPCRTLASLVHGVRCGR